MRQLTTLTVIGLLAWSCTPEADPLRTGSGNNGNNSTTESECRLDVECEEYFFCEEATRTCQPGACLDGRVSEGETDVDCGGDCEPCSVGQACISLGDCDDSTTCSGGVCVENNSVPNNTNNTNNVESTCEDPGNPERFVEVDNGMQIDIDTSALIAGAGDTLAGGLAVEDFDGDGDSDVAIANAGGQPSYWQNDGSGAFTQVAGAIPSLSNTTAVSSADIDGDGDPDLVIGQLLGISVLVNDGTGMFSESTDAWGLAGETAMVSSLSFADFDGDGDLDLYVGNYVDPDVVSGLVGEGMTVPTDMIIVGPVPNKLYRNTGSTFELVANSPGSADAELGTTLASAWTDWNGDGAPDLWVVNDFGMLEAPNQLFINNGPDPNDPNGWLFDDIAPTVGMDVSIFGMTATIGDIDNDQDADYYSTNMAHNVLHVRDGDSTTEEAVQRGVQCGHLPNPQPRPADPPDFTPPVPELAPFFEDYVDTDSMQYTLTSFGAVFLDANHDGWLDLYVVNGTVVSLLTPEAPGGMPNFLYLNNGDGTFSEQPCWFATDIRGTSRSTVSGDFDLDGDLDLLFVDNGREGQAGVHFLENQAAAGNWLQLDLVGAPPNTDAIGAKVQLTADAMTQTRWVDGGSTYMSLSERVAHFGLGEATSVDSVTVVWPDGTTEDVPVDAVNQRIVVTQQ